MNLLNQTLLIGRIVDEDIKAQLVSEISNVVISYFKIAINKNFFDKQKNEWVDRTQFIPLKAFGSKALYISKTFKKGDLVTLNCELDINTVKNVDGEYITYWSLIVQDIKKLGKSSSANEEISKTKEITLHSLDQNQTNANAQSIDVNLAKDNENQEDKPWELDL